MGIPKDYVNSFGMPATSPWLSGEQATRTPAPIHQLARDTDIPATKEITWSEPTIMSPNRNMDVIAIHSKSGGNSVIMDDSGAEDNDGYILIVHKSGSVFQIDPNGTILIKSHGDTHNSTKGLSYSRSSGDTNSHIGGEWNVMVEGGSGNVCIAGDLNIECENYNLVARGKATINVAEGMYVKAARHTIEAHSDNIDILAKNLKIETTETLNLLSHKDMRLLTSENLNIISQKDTLIANRNFHLSTDESIFIETEDNFNLKSNKEVRLDSDEEMKLKGSIVRVRGDTVYIDDFVRMAEGEAGDTDVENPDIPSEALVSEVKEMDSPPSRRPSTKTEDGIQKVSPQLPTITDALTDDEE